MRTKANVSKTEGTTTRYLCELFLFVWIVCLCAWLKCVIYVINNLVTITITIFSSRILSLSFSRSLALGWCVFSCKTSLRGSFFRFYCCCYSGGSQMESSLWCSFFFSWCVRLVLTLSTTTTNHPVMRNINSQSEILTCK